jgi:late competence protein required for DNA uptake (superfamily II DNA/RNA helicase)
MKKCYRCGRNVRDADIKYTYGNYYCANCMFIVERSV